MGSEDISAVLFLHRSAHWTDWPLFRTNLQLINTISFWWEGWNYFCFSPLHQTSRAVPPMHSADFTPRLHWLFFLLTLAMWHFYPASDSGFDILRVSSQRMEKHTWKFGTELVWRRWQCNVNSDHPNSHCCHQNYRFFSFTQKKRAMTKTFSMPLLWALVEH